MLWNLLEGEAAANNGSGTWIMFLVILAVMVVFMIFNRRSQKKREEEQKSALNAIKPGNKVKTIGGICGVVVEVCDDDNTLVIETGTEASGKSYLKFDKQAIYQTDAVAEKPVEKAEEKKEETKEEAKEEKAEK